MLDSLVPPQVNLVEGLWPNAALGYRALFDPCAAQAHCAAAYPNLDEEFTATVRRLDEQPMTAEVPNPAGGPSIRVLLDGYKLANLLRPDGRMNTRASKTAGRQAHHATPVGAPSFRATNRATTEIASV